MQRTLGPYELKTRLAVGGLAEIYLARKPGMLGFEQRYALKVLLPQYAESEEHRKLMIDEARLTAQLDHPNIIKVHDLSEDDDTLFIVMEYVNGLDLSQLLARLDRAGETMPIPAAIWVAQEICAGLHYAHTRTSTDGTHLRLVHRDVSPQNVLLGFGGEVKLIDFGVAKAVGGGRMETKTGIIKGKLSYMAPEYAVGSQQDHRSDIFAAALCLFEMLTGRPAYDGDPSELIEVIKNAAIPAPSSIRSDVPAELDEIVSTALARRPDDRYATAQAFQRALSAMQSRIATEFNRERFAAWLATIRRRTESSESAEVARQPEPKPAPKPQPGPPSSAHDDMSDDDFAELETMAIENPLRRMREEDENEDDVAVAATGPMEQADPRDYAVDEEETVDPERGLPDASDDLARLPTADLNVADIDPSRGAGLDSEVSTADAPTATNIDVHQIRGDRRADEPNKPRIVTQSGFQEFVTEEELEEMRAESGPSTLPVEPPEESTSPTHRIKPVDRSAGEVSTPELDDSEPQTMPPGALSTSDLADRGNTGGRGVVTPDQAGPDAPSSPGLSAPSNVADSGGRVAVDSDDAPALQAGAHGPADGWNIPEPPPKKQESMGRTAEGLVRKVGGKYGNYSKSEKGRRAVHATIVAVLAILFVGLLTYVFFIAE